MKTKIDAARDTALRILKEVNHNGKYANISLKHHLRRARLSDRDAAFVTQLVYGTLERQITIDWILNKFCSLKRANPWAINILRMGCYQIMYMDRVPDFAVCDESVKLCRKYCNKALAGFVNGVLRNIVRHKQDISFPSKEEDPVFNLSLTYSYPVWLVKKWVDDYGIAVAETMVMPAGSHGDYVTIRVNRNRITKDELKERFIRQGIQCEDGLYIKDEALRLCSAGDIENNRLYAEGFFTVQGESSMLVVRVLDPQKGELIIDACSAPGGKATHMAELMGNEGRILAWDVHPQRVELIRLNAKRLGATIVEPQQQDAREFQACLEGQADRVLIDAPCSGWGVIYKKPDIKNSIKREDLDELYELQSQIISTCSRYVKPGGILVYSTCTMNVDENQRVIEKFLERNPHFVLDDFTYLLPEGLKDSVVQPGMIQLIPSRDGIDGFFITRLKRMR
ncbi:16S rRNA (cytosine(967)-C(5))-methyltransferase RsmB [Caldicoprobacter faecalis]|uniref:16S rRNA (cytosine(967)-C(5))-methyltransferase n=1 Tax=Caldicoprobacter faecalis TaxID=937334 RepID=A0A1I5WEL4_9FIRM|nr:16S rRNA (cytosine(967)-C(5))-methyltransferase RsmB [Caldicoprobacter faecalis]SFQ18099.1 NusB antitermination factor [Caldicoprobacter faecalis]